VRLDERTVVVLDEASMTDDQDLLRLLDETLGRADGRARELPDAPGLSLC